MLPECGEEMLTGKQSEPNPVQVTEDVTTGKRVHEEQYVHYTHELSYDSKESIGRVIIRLVPLLYGGMFGALLDDMSLALTVAAIVTVGMDLAMGNQSLLRTFIRCFMKGGCPLIAALANTLAAVIRLTGLQAPAFLRDMRCGVSR